MSTGAPALTSSFWRNRRAAALAGIVFGVVLLTAVVTMRLALADGEYDALRADGQRRTMIKLSLHLVPFAGIAFLWFIGVVREQLGAIEDRLFATVFMGSGLLFVALMFVAAVTSLSLMDMLESTIPSHDVWRYGRDNSQGLISV